MKRNLVITAVKEAERFLSRVADMEDAQSPKQHHPSIAPYYEGGPNTAAVRRASMDLTRALSALRANK